MTSMIGRREFSALLGASLVAPRVRAGTIWRLATGYRPESFHTSNLQALANEVDAASQGELHIEIHPNNVLFKLAAIPAAVQEGKVEAGEAIMSGMASDVPLAGADSVPFITNSYADAGRMWQHQRPLIERQFTSRGLQVLYAVPWPPQGLFSSKPAALASDLKGSRMRTYNTTTVRIADMLGAQGVDVPMVDVARAVVDGRIDSMITSAVTGVENQVWSHLRYYYEINAWFPKNIVFANSKALQALSPRAREALVAASKSAEKRGWAASEAVAASSVDELRKSGIKVDRVAIGLRDQLNRIGERFSLEWVHQVGAEANDIFIPYFMKA